MTYFISVYLQRYTRITDLQVFSISELAYDIATKFFLMITITSILSRHYRNKFNSPKLKSDTGYREDFTRVRTE